MITQLYSVPITVELPVINRNTARGCNIIPSQCNFIVTASHFCAGCVSGAVTFALIFVREHSRQDQSELAVKSDDLLSKFDQIEHLIAISRKCSAFPPSSITILILWLHFLSHPLILSSADEKHEKKKERINVYSLCFFLKT